MADVVTLKPRHWFWLKVLEMLPVREVTLVLLSLTLGAAGHWGYGKATAKTEVGKVETSALVGTDELLHRLMLLEGNVSMIADYVAMQQAKIPGRPAPKAAVPAKAAGAK